MRTRPLAVLLIASVAPIATAATFYVTVAGLGGELEYEQRFSGWAKDIDKAVRAGGADVHAETLFGPDATRDKLQTALASVARQAQPNDSVIVLLIGHGTFDDREYKFNLPGPDISATELRTALDRIPSTRQLVVLMTSASGGARAMLEKPDRVVITATKTGMEKNATVFARFWTEAMRDAGADTDKNGVLSALETFRYAEEKTAKFYDTQKRLATEHPMLEDTGKGDGTKNPSPENGEGLLASRIAVLRLGGAVETINTPERRQLIAKKEDLEEQIDALKYQKAAMPVDQYKRKLSALLLELAKTQAELDK